MGGGLKVQNGKNEAGCYGQSVALLKEKERGKKARDLFNGGRE